MTTTDSNGIMFLQTSDNISPFQTLMNSLQSATSTAVEKATRGPLYAANTTARNALLTQYGSSASNPLWVDTAGNLERHNGTSWSAYPSHPAAPYTPTLNANDPIDQALFSAYGRYIRVGAQVTAWFAISVTGSLGAASGVLKLGLPVPASNLLSVSAGSVRMYDSSTGNARLDIRVAIGEPNVAAFQYTSSFGGPLAPVQVSAPFPLAVGDIIDGFITYEAA